MGEKKLRKLRWGDIFLVKNTGFEEGFPNFLALDKRRGSPVGLSWPKLASGETLPELATAIEAMGVRIPKRQRKQLVSGDMQIYEVEPR